MLILAYSWGYVLVSRPISMLECTRYAGCDRLAPRSLTVFCSLTFFPSFPGIQCTSRSPETNYFFPLVVSTTVKMYSLYESLDSENRLKFMSLINKSKSEFMSVLEFSLSNV